MSALRPSPALLASTAIALACVVGGCARENVVVRHRVLRLALAEYRIEPQSVRASAGLLTIVAHNYGRRTHNLVLSLDGRSVGSTKPIWPGTSARLTLFLAPGRYTLASTLLNDQTLGEYGTLVVN